MLSTIILLQLQKVLWRGRGGPLRFNIDKNTVMHYPTETLSFKCFTRLPAQTGLNGSPLYVCVGVTMERAAFITMTESILKHISKTNSEMNSEIHIYVLFLKPFS